MKVTVKWQIADGYAGKSRPHTTVFETEDYFIDNKDWLKLLDGEKTDIIHRAVQEDFDSKISFEIEQIEFDIP